MFRSFWQGGFEGSTHRRADMVQLDMIGATRHDASAETDYRMLRQLGISTVRDCLRWHLIETAPGRYDWSSFLPMLHAARAAEVQVIWDLCHYGLPHDLDIWSPAFIDRFRAFAHAAATLVRKHGDEVPIWSVMNEISFWSWGGGDCAVLYPNTLERGPELKRQLVRAAIAATEACRAVDRRARFLQAEPLINIVHDLYKPEDRDLAETYRLALFQSWDMLSGRLEPELGGKPEHLDIVGVNFYWDNQWIHNKYTIGLGHRQFVPLHILLLEVWQRYRRPLTIAETGAEGGSGPGWLSYMGGEIRRALRAGIPVEGICLYPVMDYPGWHDLRHCRCGLIQLDADYRARSLDLELARTLADEAFLFDHRLDLPEQMTLAAD